MAKAPKLPPDFKLLGEDKKAELRRKAKAAIEAEQAKSSEDAYYEQLLAAERRAVVPSERLETYTIDLAPFTDRVVIDGTAYWHGQTVTVAASVAAVLREQCYRTWRHQDHVEGKNTVEAYRRQRNAVISAKHGIIST